ncbi:MAG: hypothetical protein JRN27_08590 [Nitrososphaerota archaeon]|nr:hypothetical protein [Nitrososphaerota archaeon]
MTNVTFALPDRTVRRLQKRAAELGRRKGVISEMVDAALTSYLDQAESAARNETFSAVNEGRAVASAGSLAELARKLRAMNVDARSVLIVSSEPVEPVVHLGMGSKLR